MDVAKVLGELERIGAVLPASHDEETKEEASVVVAAPTPAELAEPVRKILEALDTVRENLLKIAPFVAELQAVRQPAPAPVPQGPVAKRGRRPKAVALPEALDVKEIPPPQQPAMPAPTPAPVIPGPPSLADARARVLAKIRGEDIPKPGGDDEDGVLYVGMDRAIPIDLSRAESVSQRGIR